MGQTIAQKIIAAHLLSGEMVKGSEIGLRIDQTLTQDATGTMAYLEFESMGIPRVKTERSVAYIDHNTLQSGFMNADDHRYIQTVAAKHGIWYSRPGNGICHQVHYERFGVPGKTLIGSDSHTPTGGGLGMLAMGAGGVHSESELWSPAKLRDRLLFNRMSGTPSWTPFEPGVWLKTGNELGDLIYQDFITDNKDRPMNRTPILEGGFRTPLFHGLWATFRLFQDDHYSFSSARAFRMTVVDNSFSFLGENWPMLSSAYGGLGFTNEFINASVLAGMEYIWIFSETSRWIPIKYKPRIEARADFGNISATFVYENAEYQDHRKSESGERHEVNGSVVYKCGEKCQRGMVLHGLADEIHLVINALHTLLAAVALQPTAHAVAR